MQVEVESQLQLLHILEGPCPYRCQWRHECSTPSLCINRQIAGLLEKHIREHPNGEMKEISAAWRKLKGIFGSKWGPLVILLAVFILGAGSEMAKRLMALTGI